MQPRPSRIQGLIGGQVRTEKVVGPPLPSLAGLLLVGVLAIGLCGCEPLASPPQAQGSSPPADAEPRPAAQVEPAKPPASFADIESAVAALKEAAEGSDQEERLRVSQWLADQGAAAVPAMAQILDDASSPGRSCIAACRVLGQIGAPAEAVLLRHANHKKSYIRLNALDQLGVLKPSSSKIVTALIAGMEHKDPQTRITSIQALAYIGPPAKRAVPKLTAILNSNAEEGYRNQAKRALLKINPRRKFTD